MNNFLIEGENPEERSPSFVRPGRSLKFEFSSGEKGMAASFIH